MPRKSTKSTALRETGILPVKCGTGIAPVPASTKANPSLKSGWQRVRFGDVVRFVKEHADPESGEFDRYVAGEHIETDNLHIRKWGTIGDGYLGPAFHRHFKKGQVLYGSRRTYLRKVAVAEFDGITANTTFVLEPSCDELIPELLPFIMQTEAFNGHSVKQSKGSVNPYINFKDIAWFEFALPPKVEQRRIAEMLWAADGAVESYRVCVKQQTNLVQAMSRDSFDHSKATTTPLGEVGVWMSGGTPDRSNHAFWSGRIPWVSPKDMKVDVLMDAEEHISEEALEQRSKLVEAGTIFIVVRGMILAHTFPVAVTGRPMAFNQDMKALRVSGDFDTKYVFHWLRHRARAILGIASDSSHGTKRLPSEHLFGFGVPKPALAEQRQIAENLDRCNGAISDFQQHIRRLEQMKKSLSAEFLGG
ncbi:MAG TPA: restriction endonuclease subunit S [Candidatus Paceibacterota bacterium]|nr:restriction endonuclease subunit S [Verrucomicrobiota bacterium]HRZ43768.1 restriction endonuclease subunit S [Candidatus Paceibacterota bacterium]